MHFGKAVVKLRIPILILAFLLMIPSVIGISKTRVNYDMMTYLPADMDTVKGQDILLDEFGKGAFTMIVLEDMPTSEVKELAEEFRQVDHVESVICDEGKIPKEMIPDKLTKEFSTDHSTLMAVFFDSATSADVTMDAVREIRSIANEKCFVAGMSAMVTDLKDLCEAEQPTYVGLAVLLACAAMMLLLDGWMVPFVFLASIGMMIVLNLGTNYFLGEISYITKALSAVLQLAVTMDYSIFLWHSYNEQRGLYEDHKKAMAVAINNTLVSVIGSSITTVAGFIALCFMSFTLGRDLGIVMAKGVILGVIGCVTVLPAMILILDKPLQRTRHRSLIPNMTKVAKGITKIFPVFLVIFAVLIPPALYGYQNTNNEVYYDMGECLPEDMAYVIANTKLQDEFNMASTHMVLINSELPASQVREMVEKMDEVPGVKYTLGLESIIGKEVPVDMLPDSIRTIFENDQWELLLVNSEYRPAADEMAEQINQLNAIIKEYDPNGMLIGEAPCMQDLIKTTSHDFQVVNAVSIIAVFVIIAFVEKSLSLPFILIGVIELAIFINLGLPHYMAQSLPFIAPICISTIQLGSTVDYAILMTTRYKAERVVGNDKLSSVRTALVASIPSIIVSGMGLFAATFGISVYTDIDLIGSLCLLMARGAVISMLCVIFILPSLLLLCDRVVCATTLGMRHCKRTCKD